jgi:hypothetical protein
MWPAIEADAEHMALAKAAHVPNFHDEQLSDE